MGQFGNPGSETRVTRPREDTAFRPGKALMDDSRELRQRAPQRRARRGYVQPDLTDSALLGESASEDPAWAKSRVPIGFRAAPRPRLTDPIEVVRPWSHDKEHAAENLVLINRIAHEGREAHEKLAEAIGNLTSDTVGAQFAAVIFPAGQTPTFPIVVGANLTDAFNESGRHLLETMFKGVGGGAGISDVGISGIVLTLASGTSAELAIAPIAKTCSIISRALTVGGIVLGLVTGAHVLVIVCTKKLLISKAEGMLAQGVAEFLRGSDSPATSGDAEPSSVLRIPAHTVEETSGRPYPALGQDVDQWLTLLLRDGEDYLNALRTSPADLPSALQKSIGEDEFLSNLYRQYRHNDTLGNALNAPLVSNRIVNAPVINHSDNRISAPLSDLPRRQLLQAEINIHPLCSTNLCGRPGSGMCYCTCHACTGHKSWTA